MSENDKTSVTASAIGIAYHIPLGPNTIGINIIGARRHSLPTKEITADSSPLDKDVNKDNIIRITVYWDCESFYLEVRT